MRKQKTITCEFFRPDFGSRATRQSLTRLLEKMWKTTANDVKKRNKTSGDDYYRLHNFDTSNLTDCRGTLLRLRTGEVPIKASLEEDQVSDVPLQAGEYVAEYCCFMYFEETDILVLQRKREVGNYKRLAEYIREKCSTYALQFCPVVGFNDLERLKNTHEIRRVDLSFAIPDKPTLLDMDGEGVGQVIDFGREFGATNIFLGLSSGRTGFPLTKEKMMKILLDTAAAHSDNTLSISKAEAKIKEQEDAALQTFKLLVSTMSEEISFPFTGNSPTTYDHYTAIEKVYEKRKDELLAMFSSANSS